MGEVDVIGREALDFLQHVTCNDVSRLAPGRIQYSALTTPDGTFVDDLLVYKRAEDDYLLVINAGNTPKDVDWLRYYAKGYNLRLEDVSGSLVPDRAPGAALPGDPPAADEAPLWAR